MFSIQAVRKSSISPKDRSELFLYGQLKRFNPNFALELAKIWQML